MSSKNTPKPLIKCLKFLASPIIYFQSDDRVQVAINY